MKLRLNKRLSCGLVAIGLLMTLAPLKVNATHRAKPLNHYVVRSYQNNVEQNSSVIKQVNSLPNQGYTNYVTGRHGLYTAPAVIRGARRLLSRRGVKQLANRRIHFMSYQKAITNHNRAYYKIVSLHHSVRGWIYETGLRSTLNQDQQAAIVSLNPRIANVEMLADRSKHQSLIDHSRVDLQPAEKALYKAKVSVASLKGTLDYPEVEGTIRQANRYLNQVRIAKPNYQTLRGLINIRTEYQQADRSVNNARIANFNHKNVQAKQDVRQANRDLRDVHNILNKIHNYHDRRDAMNLFNQALSYINSEDDFNSVTDLNGNNVNLGSLSNRKVLSLINGYVKAAQDSIIELYPQLGDFDVTLTKAYQAQNDLNQAQNLVISLKNAHLQQTELNRIKASQHNINALWNI